MKWIVIAAAAACSTPASQVVDPDAPAPDAAHDAAIAPVLPLEVEAALPGHHTLVTPGMHLVVPPP